MLFPPEVELNKVRKKLQKMEPSLLLPKNATSSDKIKYDLCEKFVIYLQSNHMTQSALAKKLKVSPSRINEIIKYRIDLFTIDKLIDLVEKLEFKIELKVELKAA